MNDLLAAILPRNRFYARTFRGIDLPVDWQTFARLPLTSKADLIADQEAHPPFGDILTYPPDRYCKYHQTSGTKGRPLAVLDTDDSWAWWTDCWRSVYASAGVTASDRLFFAFSFGPFIGFWSAYSGAQQIGAMAIPAGGADTRSRLQMMQSARPTVLMCTVTYALRLAEVAAEEEIDLPGIGVRALIHAGEPGASVPAVRDRIERAYAATCWDHAGATEVGAHSYSCGARIGLHVNEAEFIAEILDPVTLTPVGDGGRGELVLTNLGRAGWPVVRYRTGDLVEAGGRRCPCGRTFLMLAGGILGRIDDLMIIRGVNIYPSALEAIVRTFPVAEYRIVRVIRHSMEEIDVEIEASEATAPALQEAFRQRLGLRIDVRIVPDRSLPRFELKAQRVIDRRDLH
ncbi:MAG TPA: AMP-binding protein [Vicinamibacterales bacterium]